jgi:hypothetical protein
MMYLYKNKKIIIIKIGMLLNTRREAACLTT